MVKEMAAPGVHDKVLCIIRKLKLRGRVLDIAAGEGALSRRLKEMGFDVVAADINTKNFKCRDIPIIQVDANKPLPFPENSFDLVVSVETIEHLENPYGFIREVNRILKPGGYFVLTTPNTLNIFSRFLFLIRGTPYGFSFRSYKNSGHIMPLNLRILLWWMRDNTELELKRITSNCLLLPPLCIKLVQVPKLLGQVIIFLFRKRTF